jgi:hypothetical protein
MDVKELQHKLFPLHPLTLEEFKSQSRIAAQTFDCEQNESLFWRVMAEDMTEEQVCVPALPLPSVAFASPLLPFSSASRAGPQRVLLRNKLAHTGGK